MNKRLLIGGLLITLMLINGCAISDYLTGNMVSDKSYSLLTEKEDMEEDLEEIDEIEELIDEIEEDERLTEEEVDGEQIIKIIAQENELVRLKPQARDADQDELTYEYSEPLDENGEWQTNYGDAGNYMIKVTASDGKIEVSKKILLAIERVNVPPVIEDIEDIVVEEGDIITLDPKVKDPNGDLVTIDVSKPIGNDGVWEIGYTEHGNYEVIITATDGELQSIESVKIIVNRKNMAPEIESINDIEINEGDTVEIFPVVSDLNEDDVTLTISSPIGDDGLWETGYTDHGEYEIVVTAYDGEKESTETFTLKVNDVNMAPEIIDIVLG